MQETRLETQDMWSKDYGVRIIEFGTHPGKRKVGGDSQSTKLGAPGASCQYDSGISSSQFVESPSLSGFL